MHSFYLVYMSSNVSLIFGEKNREKILAAKKLFLDQLKKQKSAIFFLKILNFLFFLFLGLIYGPKQIYVPMELNFWKKNDDFIIILVLTVLNFTNNIC